MIPLRIFLAFAIAWHSLCCLPMSAEPTQLTADELAREKEIITLLHAGDFKQGEKSLRDHLKSGSNYWDLYTLGLVLLAQNRFADSVPIFEELIKLRPSPDNHFRLGGALLVLNKPREAIQCLKAFTERTSPLQEIPLIALAVACIQTNDIEHANGVYDLIWSLYPDKILTWESRAWGNLLKADPSLVKMGSDYFPFATSMEVVKWPLTKMPLKVFIAKDDSGTSTENQKTYRAELVEAFEDWQKASNGRISFKFVDAKEGCDIECAWAGVSASGYVGHTKPVSNKLGIGHASMVLQTTFAKMPTSPGYMHTVCTHEIGHALGLSHSPATADIMFPFSAGQQVTERDKNTLNHLYRDDVAVQQISETYMKNEKNEQILLSMQCAQFFIEGDIPSGIKTAQLAIDKSPDTIEAAKVWDILGVFHLKNRQMPEAEAAFKKALAHPKLKNQYRKQCLNNYAVLMKLQNKDQEALEFKKQADAIKDEI